MAASQDPVARALAGRIAAHSRWAGPKAPKPAPDAIIPEHLKARYHAEVDPNGELPLRKRQVCARNAYQRDELTEELRLHNAQKAANASSPAS